MEYREFCEKLNIEFKEKIGIMLSEEKCQSFFDFMSLLLEKNKVLNLTAITEPNDVIIKHKRPIIIESQILPTIKLINVRLVKRIL